MNWAVFGSLATIIHPILGVATNIGFAAYTITKTIHMSKDKDKDKDKGSLEIIDLETEGSIPTNKVVTPEVKSYQPNIDDLETIDSLIQRYPDKNILDVVKSLKILEGNRSDNSFFENLLKRMGIIEEDNIN